MSEPVHELIIIRRHEEEEHEQHSSAWKVAHADFMTAMMAFFLIMWLINVTDDKVRKGISEYFNPIHFSQGQTELKGLNHPDDGPEKVAPKIGHADKPVPPPFNPLKLSQGHGDQKAGDKGAPAPAPTDAPQAAADATKAAADAAKPGADAGTTGAAAAAGAGATPNAGTLDGNLAAKERAAFQDPYAILSKLAQDYSSAQPASIDVTAGDSAPSAGLGSQDDHDPFDPNYWQLDDSQSAKAVAPAAGAAKPDKAAAKTPKAKAGDGGKLKNGTAMDAAAGNGGAKDGVAAGAGAVDLGAAPGNGTAAAVTDPNAPDAASLAAAKALSATIAQSVKDAMVSGPSPELSVKATAEGVLINLTDDGDFSMFEVGSAIPDPKVVVLMERVAKALATQPGDVVIRGHTDGRPFHSDVYDNWRLSAARAHMAYYMLTRGGLDEKRVLRIEGYADRDLKLASDPLAAENRRIEILLKEAKP